jgi:branched-chain amino acid transport system substrate-binding protein
MLGAARLAENPNDGESLMKGAESIGGFTAHELHPPITLTAEDHAGTQKVRMYQVKDGKIQQIRDWFEGPVQ